VCLGIPGCVVEVGEADFPTAVVEVAGARRVVQTSLVADEGPVAVGDWLLIHVGFALARLDEGEAAQALGFLSELVAEDDPSG
jgi:hydrogenase expression/formation protein HypC